MKVTTMYYYTNLVNLPCKVKRLRTLGIKIFKTLNNQNPSFMREIFYRSPYVSHKKQNLFIQSHKSNKSLKTLGPQIWN